MYVNANQAGEGKGVPSGFSLGLQYVPGAPLSFVELGALITLNQLSPERSGWQGLMLWTSSVGLQQSMMDEFPQSIASRCSLRECLGSLTQFNLRHK